MNTFAPTPVSLVVGRHLALFTLLLGLVALPGCSVVQVVTPFSHDAQLLHSGEQNFDQGQYRKAEEIFSKILATTADSQIRNTALYDLACTRMITAETASDFFSAVNLLDDWQKSYPSGIYVENPNLIITALKKRARVTEHEKHRALLKDRENQEVIAKQRDKIQEMKHLLQTLQHQMTELEAIDQQLQEKKKPL